MSTSPIREVFDQVERFVGGPLEKAISLPEASYVLMAAGRTWRFGLRRIEDLRSGLVHAWSLPSHRDVQMLSAQLARLQRDVEEIEQRIEDRGATWS